MLNFNNLNMYFDGSSLVEDVQVAHFTASFNGVDNINFSFNASSIDALRLHKDTCIADFNTFVANVLEATDSEIEVNPVDPMMM